MWNKLITNKRKIIFVVIIIIIIIIVFLVYKFLSPTPASFSALEKSTGEKLNIADVSVNNFYKIKINTNPRGDTLFSQSTDYQIMYFSKEEQFLISIMGSPFEEKRALAELNFTQVLGITQEEACKLNVIINTPSFANPEESGTNYKLSFCDK